MNTKSNRSYEGEKSFEDICNGISIKLGIPINAVKAIVSYTYTGNIVTTNLRGGKSFTFPFFCNMIKSKNIDAKKLKIISNIHKEIIK